LKRPFYNINLKIRGKCSEKIRKKDSKKVMREYKKGKLPIGKSKKPVKSRKQAIAIALSEAGMSKKRKKNEKK
jgi:hypothetical protein